MRSEIVTAALETQNAFALCHRVFKLVRKSHRPSTRIEETANDALMLIVEDDRGQVNDGSKTVPERDESRE